MNRKWWTLMTVCFGDAGGRLAGDDLLAHHVATARRASLQPVPERA